MTLPYYIAPTPKQEVAPAVLRNRAELGAAEVLTGNVQGKSASDLEERAAKSHYTLGIPFTFRVRISVFPVPKQEPSLPTNADRYWFEKWRIDHSYEEVRQLIPLEMAMNLPGELEIDILADRKGVMWPIMIDGQIGHFMSTAEVDLDTMKTDALNVALAPYGAHPVVRVPFWVLKTQDQSDEFFKNLYQEI